MSVQDAINKWGAYQLARVKKPVPEGTMITLEEDLPSSNYCETCGPDPITVWVRAGDVSTSVYMSMGEVIQELLAFDQA